MTTDKPRLKKLTLLRHAKSSWAEHDRPDHERTLNARGQRDAPVMAERLIARDLIPDTIYCSTATRAVETTALLMKSFCRADLELQLFEELYLASPATLLSVIESAEQRQISHLMVVAHNPGLEDLGGLLSASAMPSLPTTGLYHFSCHSYALGQPLQDETANAYTDAHQEHTVDESVMLEFQDYPKNHP